MPRAERTATTLCPASRALTTRRAARLISSAPATEVPPNFITTMSVSTVLIVGLRIVDAGRPREFPERGSRRLGELAERSACGHRRSVIWNHTWRYIGPIYLHAMELSPTAYVILGMVSTTPHSGYEIKALVDNSTRFFWAASYGQIYPELKRLSEAGLVEGSDSPTRRAQTDRLRDHRGRPRRA